MDLSKAILVVLIGVLLAVSTTFVLPFLSFVLLSVILAYLLVPLQRRLERRIGRKAAATALVGASTIAVVLPVAYVVQSTATEALTLVDSIQAGEGTLADTEARVRALTGMEIDLVSILQSAVRDVEVDSVVGLFGAAAHIALGLGLTLFLLYYFLKDRRKFLDWLRETAPLAEDVQDNLYAEVDRIMAAVLVGHVLIALVQGVLAGIGLFVTDIPNATFWTVIMIVLSLLPIVGSFLVWGPAVIYLLVNDATVAAVALFVWGTVVVGISDDYLRPVVVDRYAQVSPAVILIGVLGGVYALGFMGIFFGPVIIGALRAALDVFREEYGERAEHGDGG